MIAHKLCVSSRRQQYSKLQALIHCYDSLLRSDNTSNCSAVGKDDLYLYTHVSIRYCMFCTLYLANKYHISKHPSAYKDTLLVYGQKHITITHKKWPMYFCCVWSSAICGISHFLSKTVLLPCGVWTKHNYNLS